MSVFELSGYNLNGIIPNMLHVLKALQFDHIFFQQGISAACASNIFLRGAVFCALE